MRWHVQVACLHAASQHDIGCIAVLSAMLVVFDCHHNLRDCVNR